jgi:gas vesicle protein
MAQRASPSMTVVALAAGMTGAALALLFAPRSGVDTRRKLQDKAEELKDQAELSLHDLKDSVATNADRARDRFSTALQTAGKKMKDDDYENPEDLKNRPTVKQSPVLNAWEEEV